MLRCILTFLSASMWLLAGDKFSVSPMVALSGLLVIVGLFFWAVYKAIKTQELIYALAMLPFFLLMISMFVM